MIYRELGKVGLREFFDRIIKWRIGIQWYLALVGVPLFIYLSTVGLHVLRGGSFPDPFSQVPLSMALPVFLLIMVIGGGNEEPGWRGYALPKLQTKYNATVSSLILGVVWGFWHLPLFFIPGSPQEGVFFPGFLLLIMGRTFILTWFYNNTKSVFGCIVLHAWFNLSTVYFLMPNTTDPIFVLLSLIVLWVVVIVLLAVFGTKRLSRKSEAVEVGL